MFAFTPVSHQLPDYQPLHHARRRRMHQHTAPLLIQQQQLPLRFGATVNISNSVLYPVVGAAVGALFAGLPGALIGGVAGYLLIR